MNGNDQAALLLRQWAVKAARSGRAVPGRFLTGSEKDLARRMANENGVRAVFDGGHADADREQICYCPDDEEPDFTAVWVRITWDSRFVTLRHSDLLGSLMSLGIEREWFGDLITGEDRAWLAALPEIAYRLTEEWTEAGHTRIHCEVTGGEPDIAPPQGKIIRDTVPSLRLDAVLASAANLSRTKAAEMIRRGLVSVDHTEEERTDRQLAEGALLSVRGWGRVRLREVGEPTRKHRLPVVLELFTRD